MAGGSSSARAEASLTRSRGASRANGCVTVSFRVDPRERRQSVRGFRGIWHDSRRLGRNATSLLTEGRWRRPGWSGQRAARLLASRQARAGRSCRVIGVTSAVPGQRQKTSDVGRCDQGSTNLRVRRVRGSTELRLGARSSLNLARAGTKAAAQSPFCGDEARRDRPSPKLVEAKHLTTCRGSGSANCEAR